MQNLIALDWGTSSFRAYLLNRDGKVLEKIEADAGILSIAPGGYAKVLHDQLGRFTRLAANTPIVAAGMITSRQGWLETPYVCCPAGIEALAAALCPLEVDGLGIIWFVPGVKQLNPQPDIMRGEETQLAGAEYEGSRIALLPGTHSKWVTLEDGLITGFTTFLTGDLYKAVLQQTILRVTPEGTWSEEAFREGTRDGFSRMRRGHGLLSGLFQIRAKGILGLSAEESARSYLSGMLIGCEIAESAAGGFATSKSIIVIGGEQLADLYVLALKECGLQG
ncbi:MAG: 2-dehydro-3-deoxygalactonokinase, partial [Desulfocapsaceae bacterium]|nr:2-dehydro-3-deoxygalactonokinase [Desulfocapsaceae bacterium]